MRAFTTRWLMAAALSGSLAPLVATPAGAIDSVTGTYEGKLKCRQVVAGVASKLKLDVTVEILELDSGLVALDVVSGATEIARAVRGFLAEDSGKEKSARFSAAECGLSWGSVSGSAVHAEVAIKPGSTKGKLKGTVIGVDDEAFAASICTFSAKRITTTDPEIAPCL